MRGTFLGTLLTILFFIIIIGASLFAMIFFSFSSGAQDNALFQLFTSIKGTSLGGGLLQYRIAGDPVTDISIRTLARGTLQSADAKSLSLYIARLRTIFNDNLKVKMDNSLYATGFAPVFCGSGNLIAYCENAESGCSSGRIGCIGSECNSNVCGEGSVCCKELFNVQTQTYQEEPELQLCQNRKGICEIIECAPGRGLLQKDDSCAVALSREKSMQPVPLFGLEQPFLCCIPLGRDELRRTVERRDEPVLEVPLLSSGDQQRPSGYVGKIEIVSGG
ncbi:MAG: hypothetical protein HYW25_00695 [Candidatus Aenigmarchaeota archaeon]|nr:hypothetical protein [Candidatus Aenigmarchaeota archaeon]